MAASAGDWMTNRVFVSLGGNLVEGYLATWSVLRLQFPFRAGALELNFDFTATLAWPSLLSFSFVLYRVHSFATSFVGRQLRHIILALWKAPSIFLGRITSMTAAAVAHADACTGFKDRNG